MDFFQKNNFPASDSFRIERRNDDILLLYGKALIGYGKYDSSFNDDKMYFSDFKNDIKVKKLDKKLLNYGLFFLITNDAIWFCTCNNALIFGKRQSDITYFEEALINFKKQYEKRDLISLFIFSLPTFLYMALFFMGFVESNIFHWIFLSFWNLFGLYVKPVHLF
ncbi:MAG: hypothetical protein ACK52I_11655 [Pseudomonadota bacterium]|jgi:hypothetical protein